MELCNNCGQNVDNCSCTIKNNLSENTKLNLLRKDIIKLKDELLDKVTKPLKVNYGNEGYYIEKKKKNSEVRKLSNSLKQKLVVLELIKKGIELK